AMPKVLRRRRESGDEARGVSAPATPKIARRPVPGPSPHSLHGARTRKENALADMRVLELRRRQGELVESADVRRAWAGIPPQIRAGVLATPPRVRAQLPHLPAHDVETIAAETRAVLTALANDAAR